MGNAADGGGVPTISRTDAQARGYGVREEERSAWERTPSSGNGGLWWGVSQQLPTIGNNLREVI